MEGFGWGRIAALFSVVAFVLAGCAQSGTTAAVPRER